MKHPFLRRHPRHWLPLRIRLFNLFVNIIDRPRWRTRRQTFLERR